VYRGPIIPTSQLSTQTTSFISAWQKWPWPHRTEPQWFIIPYARSLGPFSLSFCCKKQRPQFSPLRRQRQFLNTSQSKLDQFLCRYAVATSRRKSPLTQQLLHFRPLCDLLCRKGPEESNHWHCLVKNPMDHSSSPCADRNPRSVGCLNMAKTDRNPFTRFLVLYNGISYISHNRESDQFQVFSRVWRTICYLSRHLPVQHGIISLLLGLDLPETGRPYDANSDSVCPSLSA
jgi:hypothetical protein